MDYTNIYLNYATTGVTSQNVNQSIFDFMEFERRNGAGSQEVIIQRFKHLNEARSLLARVLQCGEDELALTSNTTEGINIVFNGLNLTENDEIIITNHEHYSCLIPIYNLNRTLGIRIKVFDLNPYFSSDYFDKAGFLSALENQITEKTKAVLMSHILFTNGLELPVREICEFLKKSGIYSIIDGAQSVGHVSVNLKELCCDFYVWTCCKWLNAPSGLGGVYIRREHLHNLSVVFSGWRSVINSHELEYKNTAARFEISTCNFALILGLKVSLEEYMNIGIDNKHQIILSNVNVITEMLKELKTVQILSINPRNGILSFRSNRKEYQELEQDLRNSGVVCRGIEQLACIRFSIGEHLNEAKRRKLKESFSTYI